MPKEFTEEQIQKYLKHPYVCPDCGSTEISSGQSDFCDNKVYQNVRCKKCKREWQDVYTLTNIEPNQF